MRKTTQVLVPDIGEFQDVEIIEVHVKPGDRVKLENPKIPIPEASLPSGAESLCLTCCCTSLLVMRPLRPVPFTLPRSTPNSRANLRTDGLA